LPSASSAPFIGGFLFGLAPLPVESGLVGAPITAAIGTALVLYLVGRIKRA
jgi:hypothetical protein